MRGLSLILITALQIGCLKPSHGKNTNQGTPEQKEISSKNAPNEQFELLNPIAAGLRGYLEIQDTVQQRLLKDSSVKFPLINLIEPDSDVPSLFGDEKSFVALLGAYSGGGLRQDYQGRDPNALNMLLWFSLFHLLAKEIITACDASSSAFNDAILKPVCTIKRGEFSAEILDTIWNTIIANDAPEGELALWRGEVLEVYSQPASETTLREIIVEVFMNPYFMIARR